MNFKNKNKILLIGILSITLWHCRNRAEPGGDTAPDLTIMVSASSTNVAASAMLTLTATVSNTGGASPETTLRWYLSTDDSLDTNTDTSSGMGTVGEMETGASVTIFNMIMAPGTTGTSYYFACVDGVTGEADTSNNCSSAVTIMVIDPEPAPDLAIRLSASSSNVAASAVLNLTATVSNTGGASPGTTLRWYLSADDSLDTETDTPSGTETFESLAAGASQMISRMVMAPNTTGAHHYFACVDTVTDEINTSNNCSSAVMVVVVTRPVPDLTVVTSLTSVNAMPSEDITLEAVVSNTGTGSSPATTLRWYLSTDSSIGTDDTPIEPLEPEARSGLAAGTSATVSNMITVSSEAGTYYYGVCVDIVTGETDTTNNCSSAVTVVVAIPETNPDLTVSITASSTNVGTSAMLTLTAMVSNAGTGPSPETADLRWYLSADSSLDTVSDTLLETDEDAVSILAAGASQMIMNMITAPMTAGTYHYFACVGTVTDEANTMNNCSSGAMVVVTAPDLTASISTSSTNAETSAMLTLTATVGNAGGSSPETADLRWYLSADNSLDTESDTLLETDEDAVSILAAGASQMIMNMITAPATAGTYYYFACAGTVTDETNTSNNCSSGAMVVVVTRPAPDLTLSITASSASVATSAMLTLTATVGNTGTGSSPETADLLWYLSADNSLDTNADTLLETDEDAVSILAAGASQMIMNMITAPMTAGTYYYFACADTVTDETNTMNNCSSGAAVVVTAPDLTASISTSSTNIETSAMLTLTATVSNTGTGPSPETTDLRWYLSADNSLDTNADTLLETDEDVVSILAAGASTPIMNMITAPSEAGTYHYFACAGTVTDESNTMNNCSSGAAVVVTTPVPDLTVSISTSSTSVVTSAMLTLTATVGNTGTGSSSETADLRWYLSADNSLDTNADTLLETDEDAVSILAAGASQMIMNMITAPMTAGTYHYFACAGTVTDESNTSNNCSSGAAVVVTTPVPDLTVSISPGNTNVADSAMFTLTATVGNTGTGPSSETTDLRWYLSADNSLDTVTDTLLETDEDAVSILTAGASQMIMNMITAPATARTYYYFACAGTVTDESNTMNNCSSGATVVVIDDNPGVRIPTKEFTSLRGPQNSYPIGLWSNGTTIWVSDNEDNRLYAYDLATMARVPAENFNTLGTAGNESPTGIWSDGTTMWVADWDDDKIYAYNLTTKARDAAKDFNTLIIAANTSPSGLWSDGVTMWVVDSSDSKLFAYNLTTKARDSSKEFLSLDFNGNTNPRGIWSDGTTMWVSDWGDNSLFAYNMSTKAFDLSKKFRNLELTGNASPRGIWSDGTTMWVADREDAKLYAYNRATKAHDSDKDFETLNDPGEGNENPRGIWSNGTTMWIADTDDNKLYAYVLASRIRDSDKDLALAAENGGSEGIWSNGTTMWVADHQDDKLYAYDMASKTRIPAEDFTLATENTSPSGIWSNGVTLWVADWDDDKLYAYVLATKARDSDKDITLDTENTSPRGIWSDGVTMWVTDLVDDKLYAYTISDKNRDSSKDFNTLFASGNRDLSGIWSDHTTMWVVDSVDDKLYAYDARLLVNTRASLPPS